MSAVAAAVLAATTTAPSAGLDLADLAAGAGLVSLVVLAAIRVLTHDRDEAAIIASWKDRALTESARADRFDEQNRRLRRRADELLRYCERARSAGFGDEIPPEDPTVELPKQETTHAE